jgi:hypothetical protein
MFISSLFIHDYDLTADNVVIKLWCGFKHTYLVTINARNMNETGNK